MPDVPVPVMVMLPDGCAIGAKAGLAAAVPTGDGAARLETEVGLEPPPPIGAGAIEAPLREWLLAEAEEAPNPNAPPMSENALVSTRPRLGLSATLSP